MDDTRRLESLLDQIYGAAIDPVQWTDALRILTHSTGSEVCALFFQDKGGARVIEFVGQDETAVAAYNEYYCARNPWTKIPRKTLGDRVGCGHEYLDKGLFERTEFYNDWLRPQGLYDSMGYIVERSDGALLALSNLRSKRAGLYSGRDKQLMSRVSPHIKRAIDIHRRLSIADALRDGLTRGLDRLDVGVLLVTGDSRILFANRSAEGVLQRGDGLVSKRGRLMATTSQASMELGRQIRAVAATDLRPTFEPGGVVKLPTLSGKPMMVLVSPWRSEMRFGLADPAAIVFVNNSNAAMHPSERYLARAYDLVPSEVRLLIALLEGKRLADYADVAGITVNTAKGYLKQLFSKTGTSRQSDLVRLILSDKVLRLASI